MATTREYKGHQITVWTKKIGKHWDWEFAIPSLRSQRNDDSLLDSQSAAEDEAFSVARAVVDRS